MWKYCPYLLSLVWSSKVGTWNCGSASWSTYIFDSSTWKTLWYVHIDHIRSTSEVDESVISDPVFTISQYPSVVPNPIVTPISENIEKSSTVEKDDSKNITYCETPLHRSTRNIRKPEIRLD